MGRSGATEAGKVSQSKGIGLQGDPPLLERVDEVNALQNLILSSQAGAGGVIVVHGSAGTGKTRLLQAGRQLAQQQRLVTASSRGMPSEVGFGLGVITSLLQPQLERASESHRARLLAGAAAPAAALLFGGGAKASSGDVFPLLNALTALCANLAADDPLLLTVDDAQWADASSRLWLSFLAARLDELPIAVLVGLRRGAGEEERELLESLLPIPTVARMTLDPLGAEASRELVEQTLPEATSAFCDACWSVSGGNPLLLCELTREIRANDVAPDDGGAAIVRSITPGSVSAVTLARLRPLGADATTVARALAVLGRGAPVRHLVALTGLERSSVNEAVGRLSATELIDAWEPFSFIHPLIRSVIYEDVEPMQRAEMHLAAAELFGEEGADVALIAAHLIEAPRRDSEWSVTCLLEAGRNACAIGDVALARTYLGRALQEPARGHLRRAVLLELGEALRALGDPAAAGVLDQAVELSAAGAERGWALLSLGRAHYAAGELEAAATSYERGVEEARPEDPELAMRLMSDYHSCASLLPERMQDLGRRMEDAVGWLEGRPLDGAARSLLATAALHICITGQPHDEALALLARATEAPGFIAVEGSDSNALYSISGAQAISGRPDLAAKLLGEAIDDARRRGSLTAYATASYCRIYANYLLGRIGEAVADAEAALAAHEQGWNQYLTPSIGFAALALIEHDELDRAEQLLDRVDPASSPGDPMMAPALWARGNLLVARGNSAAAIEDYTTWGQIWPVPNPAVYCQWRTALAIALIRSGGDREQARELAAEEVVLARRFNEPRAVAIGLRGLGIATGGGEGIELLEQSVALLAPLQAGLDHCRSLLALGIQRRLQRDAVGSRETLRAALEVAQRHDLRRLQAWGEQELRVSGGRPRRRSLSGRDSLTPAELRVAAMAAEGMTNRQIAEALFVTRKAVSYHLGNVYRKLGSSSREELPALLTPPAEASTP